VRSSAIRVRRLAPLAEDLNVAPRMRIVII
jgi:hypothetical protein